MDVSLTARLEAYIRAQVASVLYDSASEVIRDALRRMIEDEPVRAARLERLREEIAKGDAAIAAGDMIEFETDKDLADYVARL